MRDHADLLAAVRSGLTGAEIASQLGIPDSTVRYQAARHGLTLATKRPLKRRGDYWARKMRRVWARMRKETM